MSDPFRSEILAITPVQPGCRVEVRHFETPPGSRPQMVEKLTHPIVAWALVRATVWPGGHEMSRVEPVFIPEDGRPVHATEYQRLYSDVHPSPGEAKTTISVAIKVPRGES